MKTAGVVFDFYDDIGGSVLKEVYPTPDSLPASVKEAHILRPEEREVLRDDAYALVMQNEGKVLRKFACVDRGNTLLSMVYIGKTAGLLPEEVRNAAYENIVNRAVEFGILKPEAIEGFKKISAAKGMQRTRDSMRQPIVGEDADWAARTNLVSQRGGADSGRVIPTANQMKTAAPIDVTDLEPEMVIETKQASVTALGKYPLDSYADIRAAADYFDRTWTEMDPADRHEFAVKTASRAEEIGLTTSDLLSRYGSTEYAPDVEAHLASRKLNCDPEFHPLYDELKAKYASIAPEEFVEHLAAVDELAGLDYSWGGQISDPWYSTFGGASEQEKVAFVWSGNGVEVDAEALTNLAGNKDLLLGAFDKNLVDGFVRDPVTIFSSLPDDAKTILANLANGG
jgi:hypothetical protein